MGSLILHYSRSSPPLLIVKAHITMAPPWKKYTGNYSFTRNGVTYVGSYGGFHESATRGGARVRFIFADGTDLWVPTRYVKETNLPVSATGPPH
ncbi:unnamed protein product [Somion occarium]|uniref:Uncharacterized protein n=1 Tax=Somion occarium TaxID=3059160 RepID=A0ABP1DUK6_9APHY